MKKLLTLIFAAVVLLFSCEDDSETTLESKACFNYSPIENLKPGDKITFTNCSENATSIAWDFGDGNVSTDENPTHSYETVGEFTVIMIAANETSADTVFKQISVEAVIPSNYFLMDGKYYELSGGIFDIMSGTVSDEPSYVSYFYLYSEGINYSETDGSMSGIGTIIEVDLYSATNEFAMGSFVYDVESTYHSGTFDGGYGLNFNAESWDANEFIEFNNDGTLNISKIGDEYEIIFNSSKESFYYKGTLIRMVD